MDEKLNAIDEGESECPICFTTFPLNIVERHAATCSSNVDEVEVKSVKRPRADLMSYFSPKAPKSLAKSDVSSRHSPRTENSANKVIVHLAEKPSMSTVNNDLEADINVKGNVKNIPHPLSEEMRPKSMDEFVGQKHILQLNSLLRKLIQSENIPSMILWGPPGCGKTSLAKVIGKSLSRAKFVSLSATSAGVNQVKQIITNAKSEWNLFKRKTILFLDEIHRFNKLQQDTFLPVVENGTIILIGATTENPSFSLNSALLSRCKVFVFEKLSTAEINAILVNAIQRLSILIIKEKTDQLCSDFVYIEEEAVDLLANSSDGDARMALNCLSLVRQSLESTENLSDKVITVSHIKDGLLRSHLLYDRKGDEHYNCISALHKSMRGGDGDAALYWLGRMLEGGEDPLYVARRLIRFSSEDIGLADSNALSQAVASYQACQYIGMPECEVILAQCVVYLAEAPKSVRVYRAYSKVKECIKNHEGALPGVPIHLRNAPTVLMKNLNYGKEYKYNPDYDEPVDQTYLPDCLENVKFLDLDE
ncbi:Werner helicase interacting protein 1 [Chamberlinius hualienensis]